MSTTEGAGAVHAARPPGRVFDARFAKRLVTINGLVPAVLLAWDAYHHQLGVNEVNFAIRTTGLVGLIFLVLSLLVTPLRKWTGWNQLIAIRRNLGVLAFCYLALHFAIFFALDRAGSVTSTLHEIVERVYLWFGAAALVMMIPLAATSTDGMVTRLGARRWKRLHRLAYPIAVCGVVHYYLLVKSDVRQPLVFAVIAGALLAYRAVRHHSDLRAEVRAAHARLADARARAPAPRRTWWSGELKVARIFDETHDVKTFRLTAPGGGPLPFDHIAGQYLNLALTIDGKRVNRSYTIASPPTRTAYCEISVKRAVNGRASQYLHDAWREGSLVKVSAPAGRFVLDRGDDTAAGCAVLIAGGVGITPMMSIVRCLTDRCWPGEIYLLISVRTVRDIVFRDELSALEARFPNLHVRVTLTGDRDAAWTGACGQISRGMIEDFIPGFAPPPPAADPRPVCPPQPVRGPILVCGPEPMMAAVRRLFVHELGVPDCNILQEAFVSPPDPDTLNASAIPDVAALGPAPDMLASLDPDAGIPMPVDAVFTVKFQRAGKTAELPADVTVLEAAEAAGVEIPFECRAGICGQCKTRLISGTVTMATQDALTTVDRSKGLILACQSRAAGNVIVDA